MNKEQTLVLIAEYMSNHSVLKLSLDPRHDRVDDHRILLTVEAKGVIVEQGHFKPDCGWHVLYLAYNAIVTAVDLGIEAGKRRAITTLTQEATRLVGL